MTSFRIIREKGASKFWIQTAMFNLFGLRIIRHFVGTRKTQIGPSRRRTFYNTRTEALQKIRECIQEEEEYTESKSFKGNWI